MKREPLINRAVITAALALAVALGLVTTELADALVVVLAAAAPLVVAAWTREKVTPLIDPRDLDGVPLVRGVLGGAGPLGDG